MKRDHHALAAFLAGRIHLPFRWAENDCVSFAFDAVKAQTGVDKLSNLGSYKTARGAAGILRREGGVAGICDKRLTLVSIGMAQRGDVGLVKNQDGADTLVVVDGAQLVGVGLDGPVRLPRSSLLRAWSAT